MLNVYTGHSFTSLTERKTHFNELFSFHLIQNSTNSGFLNHFFFNDCCPFTCGTHLFLMIQTSMTISAIHFFFRSNAFTMLRPFFVSLFPCMAPILFIVPKMACLLLPYSFFNFSSSILGIKVNRLCAMHKMVVLH